MPKYRDIPCELCGWTFMGFHVCLDLPEHVMQRVEDGRTRDSNGKIKLPPPSKRFDTTQGSAGHRAAIAAGVRRRAASDPRRIERNREILRLYGDEEMSMREVATKLRIDPRTVMTVLHTARDNGDVIIRRAGRRTGKG